MNANSYIKFYLRYSRNLRHILLTVSFFAFSIFEGDKWKKFYEFYFVGFGN